MGRRQKSKSRIASLFGSKSFRIIAAASVGTFIFIQSACQTSKFKNSDVGAMQAPKGFSPPEATLVTNNGFNKRPQLGPNGKRLVYVSSMRDRHKQFQAYLFDLESKKERRLTYDDGDVYDVHIDRLGTGLVYSSSTDEIKEDSDYIRKALEPDADKKFPPGGKPGEEGLPLPRTEIYQSTLNGYRIVRMTHLPGFDGMVTVHPSKAVVVFTRWRQRGPQLEELDLNSKTTVTLQNDGYNAQYSPNGKQLAWLEKGKELYTLKVGSSKATNEKSVYANELPIVDFNWGPNSEEIYFSRQLQKESQNSELFRLRLKDGCVQRLTYNVAHDLSPVVSKDLKTLYFESDRLEVSQIFSMSLENLPSCELEPTKLE